MTERVQYTEEMNNEIGIVILAAGASTRFGSPKQLINFGKKSLLSKAVQTALESNASRATLVLGANSELMLMQTKNVPINTTINADWKTGIASSIKHGLSELLKESDELSAAIFMLCDQPMITAEHINQIIDKFAESKKPIIASSYKNTLGVPALFTREMFAEIMKLEGDKGAKNLISAKSNQTTKVDIPEAEFDIDTSKDLQRLLDQK